MKDSFNREITYLRISVTDLCNLRCRYCMPENGVCKMKPCEVMDLEEISMAIKAAASLGINKVRITGGEPLVKRGILDICRDASLCAGVDEVCITTNGILLPKMADDLKAAGVKRINISLDTLDADKYAFITRGGKLRDALDGIEKALDTGFEKIKLNAVLIGGFNDDEIPSLAELTKKWNVDMRFIEMMPMYDSGDFKSDAFISCDTVLEKLPDLVKCSGDDTVAKLYKMEGGLGKIGLISPVSAHFCGECNRIRLTSDGKIKPCLHSAKEYPIKGLDYDQMVEVFKTAIGEKPQWHGQLSYKNRSNANRNMNEIGG